MTDEQEHSPRGAVKSAPGNPEEPIFIVGPGRSGTTLLAVLLDRHSRIAVPPETHFYSRFIPEVWPTVRQGSRREKVEAALNFVRIAEAGLAVGPVLERFERYDDTAPQLFRAILETYAAERGAVRLADKTPRHLVNVDLLFDDFPRAKVVAIVRDGRDVVRSAMKTPWMTGNPRRFGLFCRLWSEYAGSLHVCVERFPPDRFHLLRYEDLVREPERQLRRVCEFIGEPFELRQLDMSVETGVVPDREEAWKGKARTSIDASRAEAWRSGADREEIWRLNFLLGDTLRLFDYADTDLRGCPWHRRLYYAAWRAALTRPVRAVGILALRLLRTMGLRVR